jgi:hypothetical protein
MPTPQIEPGLISRSFGSHRDGQQEIIEVWDVTAKGCLMAKAMLGPTLWTDSRTGLVTRKYWIAGICCDSVRLHEAAA